MNPAGGAPVVGHPRRDTLLRGSTTGLVLTLPMRAGMDYPDDPDYYRALVKETAP